MKNSLKNISRMLLITGCMSVLVSNMVVAAPQTYDMGSSDIRSNYALPNRIKLTGDVNFDDHGQTITLSLRNTDVQQVLRMFADKAGLNIVFHESAQGNVTLDLVDVTLEDAFKMVMKMCNLTYVIKDKTMLVVSTTDAEKVNLTKDNITVLPVKYVDAAYIANFLNSNVFSLNTPGLSYGPIVTTNADKNELLIFGTDNDYILAKKIVDRFDRKPSMTTYRVNHTTPFEMAKMICETLFQLPASGTTSSNGGVGTYRSELKANFTMQTAVPQNAAGSIGGGSIVCSMASSVQTDNIASFQAKPSVSIYVQPELGTLTMVGGSAQQVEMVNEFILENDRKQPQAYLEVQLLELSEEGSRVFNNSWQYNGKHINVGFSGGTTTVSDLFWHGNITRNQAHTLKQTISYIITNGKGKELANPKIVITNGKKSIIDLTEDYVKTVTSQYLENAGGGGQGAAVAQKTYEIGDDAGIKIEVLPFISPDGYVSLTIKPDYASVASQIKNANGDPEVTLLARHNLELTNVRIKDEDTLMIGGLIKEKASSSQGKIPLLGDIPVLGFLFRNESRSNTKSELLIMITPRIIKDTEDVVDQV